MNFLRVTFLLSSARCRRVKCRAGRCSHWNSAQLRAGGTWTDWIDERRIRRSPSSARPVVGRSLLALLAGEARVRRRVPVDVQSVCVFTLRCTRRRRTSSTVASTEVVTAPRDVTRWESPASCCCCCYWWWRWHWQPSSLRCRPLILHVSNRAARVHRSPILSAWIIDNRSLAAVLQ